MSCTPQPNVANLPADDCNNLHHGKREVSRTARAAVSIQVSPEGWAAPRAPLPQSAFKPRRVPSRAPTAGHLPAAGLAS
jgi:hypothetical protein